MTNPMDPIRRKLPLRPSHLDAFLCIAHRTGRYDDLFFAALLSCCFYACHRSSELVWKNQKDLQDWWKVIKRASLHFSDGCVGYHLPYHKADHFYHRTEVLFTHWDIADPVALLQEYTTCHDAIHGGKTALFICKDSTVPTCAWFDSKFLHCLITNLGGTLLGLEVLHFILVLGSLRTSSKHWAIGLRGPGRTTFVITLPQVGIRPCY